MGEAEAKGGDEGRRSGGDLIQELKVVAEEGEGVSGL